MNPHEFRFGLTLWRRLRLRAVMRFARFLRVPVDVHGSFLRRQVGS